jgi:hypothetical protein
MRTFALALALLLVGATGAAAKSGVELSTPPDGLHAGQPWVVDVTLIHGDRPAPVPGNVPVTVVIDKVGTGEEHVFRARPLRNGAYRARVVFPTRGKWLYRVAEQGSDVQEWPPVTILPAERSGEPARESAGGFPFGWVVGGVVVLFGTATCFAWRRRSA